MTASTPPAAPGTALSGTGPTLRTRLYWSFAVMVGVCLALGGWAWWSASSFEGSYQELNARTLPSTLELLNMDARLLQTSVAERSLLSRNQSSPEATALRREHSQALAELETHWNGYRALARGHQDPAKLQKVDEDLQAWRKHSLGVLSLLQEDTPAARRDAVDLSFGAAQKAQDSLHAKVEALWKEHRGSLDNSTRELADTASWMRGVSLTLVIIATALGVALAALLTRALMTPLNRAVTVLNSSAEQVASAARQVASSSQQMASGASEQASALEETSSSLEEMASMTRQNADNAGQARSLTQRAHDAAAESDRVMEAMNKAMGDIKTASDEVGKIIKSIDEIAFQTNLLALNAAVEAARAGDAGRGFAVVAEEVRSLAQRSAAAAKESSAKIEAAIAKTNVGVSTARKVVGVLGEISSNVKQANQMVGEISAASNEQSQGIGQVNRAVQEMDKVVQANAANAEESASAAEEMSAQALMMRDAVLDLALMVGATEARDAALAGRSGVFPAPAAALPPSALRNGAAPRKAPPAATPSRAVEAARQASAVVAAAEAPRIQRPLRMPQPEELIPLDEEAPPAPVGEDFKRIQ